MAGLSTVLWKGVQSPSRWRDMGAALLLSCLWVACGEVEQETLEEGQRVVTEGAEVVSCGDATPVETVRMRNNTFVDHVITITVDDVVRFVNEDTMAHTVTSGSPDLPGAGEAFHSGHLAPGTEFCLRFTQPNPYLYHCEVHPEEMRDALVVVSEE